MTANVNGSTAVLLTLFTLSLFANSVCLGDEPTGGAAPKVGDSAEDFKLTSQRDEEVSLSNALKKGPVVLLVLRGYPGYQCPLCTKQVADFLAQSKAFDAQQAQVILVYPGPADDLTKRGNEFLKDTKLPEGFHLLLDPDYKFTNRYHLRWDAPRETAYPSTFVIGKDGKIKFAHVSKTHGDRTTAKQALAEVTK